MGVKALFAPQIGGGVPFCRLSPYINQHSLTQGTSRVLQHSAKSKVHQNRAKRGKNEFFFGVLWCFLGIFGDRNSQNTKIFLKCGCKVVGVRVCFRGVSAGVSVQALGALGPTRMPALVLWSCIPLFLSALSLFPWCIACKYGFISRF